MEGMQRQYRDIIGLGTLFWLAGYLAGLVLYITPMKNSMGWIMLVFFTPFTILVTVWWFHKQEPQSLKFYAGAGLTWLSIAVILDFLFIVTLFHSPAYYAPDVFLYYILMFLIPVGAGLYLNLSNCPNANI